MQKPVKTFIFRLKEKEANDCSSLFSNSRSGGTSDSAPSDDADGSQRSSCSNYGTEEQGPDDNLRYHSIQLEIEGRNSSVILIAIILNCN